MGKRKQTAPQYAGQNKRQQLQWNMADQFGSSGSQSFICDGALRNESLNQSESVSGLTSLPASSTGEGSSGNSTPVHALCVDAFYQNLASCHSTLSFHNADYVKGKDKTQLLEFGHFTVTLVAHPQLIPLPNQLPEFKECWLYLADVGSPSMLYFETEDNNENAIQHKKTISRQTKFGLFWFVSLNVPVTVLTSLKSKLFMLLCSEFDTHRKSFTVTIYGKEGIILQTSHPSESVRIKTPQVAVQKLMEFYYDVQLPYNFEGRERNTGHDFFLLYECVMAIQKDILSCDKSWSIEVENIHHDCLKPVLRQYQKQSVAWMMRQEKRSKADQIKDDIHQLYCEVKLRDGTTLYYNRHAGSLVKNRPRAIPTLPGGILADEMGLGKTVEVLCCMLLHPRQDVELPDALPVLEDFDMDSTENSSSSGGTESTIEYEYDKKPPYVEVASNNECGPDGYSDEKDNFIVSSSGELTISEADCTKTGADVALLTKSTHAFDAAATNEDESFHQKLCSFEDSNANFINSGVNDISHEKLIPQGALSIPAAPQAKYTVNRNEITFLSSKETVDLTDDSNCGGVEFDIPASYSSNGHDAQLSTNLRGSILEPNFQSQNTSIHNYSSQLGSNKVIIQINSKSEASIMMDGSRTFTTVSLESAALKSAAQSNANLTATSLLNSPQTTPNGNLPPPSSHHLPSTYQSSNNAADEGAKQRKKGKRKSRGYVEYVPITNEDVDSLPSKPASTKQCFECNCGQLDNDEETRRKGLNTVKCNICGTSQHAECMNYDLKDPLRGDYRCPHCHAVSTTIKSGATLIISPYSICHQWIEEISKHIKERSIKVFIYTGVSKLGYIQPQTLAQQDIVITTYDVLRKELDYVNLPHSNSESGRRFRHPKRFLATPSPMVAVEWWRICLDEAQMVECVTTKTAEMALALKAVNRWCVTGTPLMRSVEDIYGLLLFLGVDPLLVQQWFRLLVWEPFCHGFYAPMHHALSRVLWRTAKKDVIDQIDLPDQSEEINWLTFSPVEEHFYRRQYEMYLRNAYANRKKAQNVTDPTTRLHSLDRKTMNELLSPLFRLRQACCHPQIVRGEFLPLNKSMMTMEELLEHMTKKVKTECEEAHRQIVASLNGMSGLAILRGKIPEAIDKYRDVLRSVEEHKDQFRTDELQQLHAMHNLAEMLDKKPSGVYPTLRDSSLKEQCQELKSRYMARTKVNVTAAAEVLDGTQSLITDLSRKLSALDGDWWADIIDLTVQRGTDNDLIYKVKDDLVRTSTTEGTIADIFTNANGLMYVIDSHLQTLTKARQNLTTQLEALANDTSVRLVLNAALCCLRPVSDVLKTCSFCKIDELFNEYESKLFLFVERGVTVTGDDINLAYQVSTRRQGTWADSEVERAIKSILAFYRLHFDADHDILEAASLHIKYMETLKKEFKNLRSLWLSHREMISAIDELEMATERLRLRKEFEPESATKILNVIEEKDMTQQELKCTSDEIIARDELRKKLGQLVYLTNLAKKSLDGEECNPDSCPICQCGLGVEWSVLMCGHCYCLNCIRALIDRNLIGGHLVERRLKCPMCRHMTPIREISYVTTLKTEKADVKGSHSTKVQAVIQCLIKIRQQDPTAKSLVFSVWVSVLDILAAALTENKIPYKSLHDPNYFQKNLSAFKSEDSIQVLLLPLHTGANGLNLVEANHVLLVEPELNLEEEAQAISRIYRIGQTRQTKIHRFMVRGTIEEKIFHMVQALRESKSGVGEEGELLELTVGHITSLLQQPGPDDEDEEAGLVAGIISHNGVGNFGRSLGDIANTASSSSGMINTVSSASSSSGMTNAVSSYQSSNSSGMTNAVSSYQSSSSSGMTNAVSSYQSSSSSGMTNAVSSYQSSNSSGMANTVSTSGMTNSVSSYQYSSSSGMTNGTSTSGITNAANTSDMTNTISTYQFSSNSSGMTNAVSTTNSSSSMNNPACTNYFSSNNGLTNPETHNESSSNNGLTNPETYNESSSNNGLTNPETHNESSSNNGLTNPETYNESSSNNGLTNPETYNESSSNNGLTNPETYNESSSNNGLTNPKTHNESSSNNGLTNPEMNAQSTHNSFVSSPSVTLSDPDRSWPPECLSYEHLGACNEDVTAPIMPPEDKAPTILGIGSGGDNQSAEMSRITGAGNISTLTFHVENQGQDSVAPDSVVGTSGAVSRGVDFSEDVVGAEAWEQSVVQHPGLSVEAMGSPPCPGGVGDRVSEEAAD